MREEKIREEKRREENRKDETRRDKKIRENKIMVSVNMDVVQSGAVIKDGDEIALLPPFSGGC